MLKKFLALFAPKPEPMPPIHLPADPPRIYLRLFHGRKTPDEDMNDWGFDGPFIGPVDLSWTYGWLKISDPVGFDMEEMITVEDLIQFEGNYYGDMDICLMDDEDIASATRNGHPLRTPQQFIDSLRADRETRRAEAKQKLP